MATEMPDLRASHFSPDEQPYAFAIQCCLARLLTCIMHISTAVSVFDSGVWIQEQSAKLKIEHHGLSAANWKLLAARDASMQVHHFYRALEGISRNLGGIPRLRESVDTSTLREVRREFLRSFPDWEALRDAVAHATELSWTPQDFNRNSRAITAGDPHFPNTGMALSVSLDDRVYTTTYRGRDARLEISRTTTGMLVDMAETVFQVFAAAVSVLERQ